MRNSHTVPPVLQALGLLLPAGSSWVLFSLPSPMPLFLSAICSRLPWAQSHTLPYLAPGSWWGTREPFPSLDFTFAWMQTCENLMRSCETRKKEFLEDFFLICPALVRDREMIFSSQAYNLAKIGCSFFCRQAACSWQTSQKHVIFQFLFPKPGGTKRKVTKFLEAWGKKELIFFQISY